MANNGFGTGCFFTSNITQTAITGSITTFKFKYGAEMKEAVDGTDNYYQVAFGKRKKVANATILIQGSGSLIATPQIGNIATLASPWTNDLTGNYGVTAAEVTYKSDDFAMCDVELTQWVTVSGSLP